MLHGIESYLAVPLIRRDGSFFGTLCSLDPLPAALDDDAFAIFRLLADLIAYELEAEDEQRKQAAQIRILEDIIAIAAHDLRQPLTVLLGRLQLLARGVRRGTPPDDLAVRLDALIAQTRRAVALSESLLDVARMESGNLAIERAPFDLAGLARQVAEDVRIGAPAHTLRLNVPATMPFVGDERRLAQVLRNLLENAVKYAPAESGPIALTIAPESPTGAAREIHVAVRDSGLGVPSESLPLLFKRNYRVPDAVAQGIQGSGLGLYIVRQIIEAHGGRVWAEAAPEGGLGIHLVLPLVPPSTPR